MLLGVTVVVKEISFLLDGYLRSLYAFLFVLLGVTVVRGVFVAFVLLCALVWNSFSPLRIFWFLV